MRFSCIATTIAATCIAACSAAFAAEPFDLRGIKLGASVDEFRRLPFPDGGSGVQTICEGDAAHKQGSVTALLVYPGDDAAAAGVKACGFFKSEGKIGSITVWKDANLKAATVGVYTHFFFVPDTKNVMRLYRISIRSNVMYWTAFWEGYTGRYGKPQSMVTDPVQNQMGAKFDNVVAIWDNGTSAITLTKRAEEIERTRIEYVHKELNDQIKAKSRGKRGNPKDNL